MAAPTLTQAEIDQLTAEQAKQQNFADSLAAQIPAKTARAAELAVADGGFKKFFDYYNDDIIGQYDAEYRALNGRYIVNPITEADIEGPANTDGSVRTTPTLPVIDIIRVPEFDGGGTATDIVNEEQHISDQTELEDVLVNGYGSGTATNATTTTTLSSGSVTLSVENTGSETIQIGDYYVVTDGINLAVILVDDITTTAGPPDLSDLDITVVVAPDAPVGTGADLIVFTGFNNTERTNKVSTDPDLQDLMDELILALESVIGDRVDRLDEQITALNANEDPDAVSQIADTLTNVNTSKTFLENYLLTTDISDTGLGTLSTERGVRSPEITARVAEINANYTGQTENYYDRRYGIANDRGNTSRGTLRLQKSTELAVTTLGDYAASAQDAVDAITDLLP